MITLENIAEMTDDALLEERDRLVRRSRFTLEDPRWEEHGAAVFTEANRRGYTLTVEEDTRWN